MGLSFDQVKQNIDYLLDVKPASLRVFTNMIDTVPMRGEIAENIRYWQSRGVQSGSSPFVNRAGNVANFDELNYRAHSARARAALRAALSTRCTSATTATCCCAAWTGGGAWCSAMSGSADAARDLAWRAISALPAAARRGPRRRAGAVLHVLATSTR